MQISYADLRAVRDRHAGQRLVLAMGGFDLTHAGHALFFEDAKRRGDVLVVGVASDATRRKERGPSRPIMNEHLRAKMVDSLKPVDYTFVISRVAAPDEHPMAPLHEVFEVLSPDVWVVNDDAYDLEHRRNLGAQYNFELAVLERTCPPEFEGVSTTGIIEKISKLERN